MIGTPAACIRVRAAVLWPISSIASGGGPTHTTPGRLDRARERRVLGEEAVARMHGLGARPLDRREQLLDVEVALRRRAPAERVRLVRARDVEGRAVGIRVHGDRAHAELAQGAEDADCDLSAIRNKDLGEHATYSPRRMSFADQLTVARIALAPVVVLLFAVDFPHHAYWGTVVFCIAMSTDWFDGRIARRSGKTSSFGSLLDPVADKVLVLATLVVLLDAGVFPAWMVAAIVGRELLISGLRLAALERGVVIPARDLGKLKTWSQAIAAVAGGLAAAGAWSDSVSWWLLLVSVALTWVSGFDYARSAPRILRGRAVASP